MIQKILYVLALSLSQGFGKRQKAHTHRTSLNGIESFPACDPHFITSYLTMSPQGGSGRIMSSLRFKPPKLHLLSEAYVRAAAKTLLQKELHGQGGKRFKGLAACGIAKSRLNCLNGLLFVLVWQLFFPECVARVPVYSLGAGPLFASNVSSGRRRVVVRSSSGH